MTSHPKKPGGEPREELKQEERWSPGATLIELDLSLRVYWLRLAGGRVHLCRTLLLTDALSLIHI